MLGNLQFISNHRIGFSIEMMRKVSVENTPFPGAVTASLPGRQVKESFLHAPTKDAVKLTISSNEGGISVIFPRLETYGLVELKL